MSDVFEQDMELDEQSDGPVWEKMDTDDANTLLQEAMEYGQILQREYRDERREYKKALEDIFSLMAYDDAKSSMYGHLLESSGRVPVAEELNSAILGMLLISFPCIIHVLPQRRRKFTPYSFLQHANSCGHSLSRKTLLSCSRTSLPTDRSFDR